MDGGTGVGSLLYGSLREGPTKVMHRVPDRTTS
jgi:hypothetical protein